MLTLLIAWWAVGMMHIATAHVHDIHDVANDVEELLGVDPFLFFCTMAWTWPMYYIRMDE